MPFFADAINSVWFQASMMLNKVLLVGNSGTIWKTKHPWIQKSFRDGTYMAGNLIKAQKSEKIPISVTVPSTVCFPLFSVMLLMLSGVIWYLYYWSLEPNWHFILKIKCELCYIPSHQKYGDNIYLINSCPFLKYSRQTHLILF